MKTLMSKPKEIDIKTIFCNKEAVQSTGLNWTPEVLFLFMSAAGFGVCLFLTLRVMHRGAHYRYFACSALLWVSYMVALLLTGTATLILSPVLQAFGIYALIIAGFFIILSMDFISRESMEPVKIFIYGILGTALVFASLVPGAMYVITSASGFQTFTFSDAFFSAFAPAFVFPIAVWFYFLAKMHWRAPKNLKKASRLYLLGYIIAGPVFLIIFVAGSDVIFPGIQFIFCGFGSIIMAAVAAQEPKLLFILPFKTLRLHVIETAGGLNLFTHAWDARKGAVNENLFSGMLQGIRLIIKESLNQGDVEEIKLTQAIIILQLSKGAGIACVLVVSSSSRSLRDALKRFTDRFCEQFKTELTEPSNTTQFASAEDLVAECFPFVPEYD